MIKRTLYFGNPIYLHTSQNQLCWRRIDDQKDFENISITEVVNHDEKEQDEFMQGLAKLANMHTAPANTKAHYAPSSDNLQGTTAIEDVGVLILDHAQITISHGLIAKLLANNVALITCDDTHHPTGLLLNLDGNTLQSQRWQTQLQATVPLKKQLWQQTVQYKIENQANLLAVQNIETGNMRRWQQDVKSGDTQNHEARAAVYYWKKIFTCPFQSN
jgi:hypothetical protein